MENSIAEQESTLALFLKADNSFKKSANSFLDFVYSNPPLAKEKRKAIATELLESKQGKKCTYTSIKENIIRICWQKINSYSKKDVIVRAITDLAEFTFYAKKKNNFEMLSKIGMLVYDISNNRVNYKKIPFNRSSCRQ